MLLRKAETSLAARIAVVENAKGGLPIERQHAMPDAGCSAPVDPSTAEAQAVLWAARQWPAGGIFLTTYQTPSNLPHFSMKPKNREDKR